jgi:hypothetical protein
MMRGFRASLAALFSLLLICACTVDDPQVNDVGAVSLIVINPLVVNQVIGLADPTSITANLVQSSYWEVTRARLSVGSEPAIDLLQAGGLCEIGDNPANISASFGNCTDSIILEAVPETANVQGLLEFDFSLVMKRHPALVLPFIGDYDTDGILNGVDNCPTITNADQRDTGAVGIGNACRTIDSFGQFARDSDDDGVPDTTDNCVDIANPTQLNSPGAPIEASVPDGVGDACVEQVVTIPSQSVAIPFDFILPDAAALVVVDFNDERVTPNCNWAAGTCTLIPSEIRVCITTNLFEAALGCPDS